MPIETKAYKTYQAPVASERLMQAEAKTRVYIVSYTLW